MPITSFDSPDNTQFAHDGVSTSCGHRADASAAVTQFHGRSRDAQASQSAQFLVHLSPTYVSSFTTRARKTLAERRPGFAYYRNGSPTVALLQPTAADGLFSQDETTGHTVRLTVGCEHLYEFGQICTGTSPETAPATCGNDHLDSRTSVTRQEVDA